MGKRVTLDDWAIELLVDAAQDKVDQLSRAISTMDTEIEYYESRLTVPVDDRLPDPDAERQAVSNRLDIARRYRKLKADDLQEFQKLLGKLTD